MGEDRSSSSACRRQSWRSSSRPCSCRCGCGSLGSLKGRRLLRLRCGAAESGNPLHADGSLARRQDQQSGGFVTRATTVSRKARAPSNSCAQETRSPSAMDLCSRTRIHARERLARWRQVIAWQVRNPAFPVTTPPLELAYLLAVGPRFRPDVEVAGFFESDIQDNGTIQQPSWRDVALSRLLQRGRTTDARRNVPGAASRSSSAAAGAGCPNTVCGVGAAPGRPACGSQRGGASSSSP